MKKVMLVFGTRPEAIKMCPLVNELKKREELQTIVCVTGQHRQMLDMVLEAFDVTPDYDLSIMKDKQTLFDVTVNILERIKTVLEEVKPDALLLYGDTNSCISVISAKRKKIPIFHMEAGNRCFDQRVPEEINRKIVDHLSDINMPLSEHARRYLVAEGLRPETVIKTGSPMTEVLLYHKVEIENNNVLEKENLKKGEYFIVSTHREENVDSDKNFADLLSSLNAIVDKYHKKVIVSTHPRTRKKLESIGFVNSKPMIEFMKPFGFMEYIKLQQNAFCVISDSGTITEEASILHFPAITIRQAHERPEGMDEGTLIMTGLNSERILDSIDIVTSQYAEGTNVIHSIPDYAADNVSKKVVRIILSYTDYVNRTVWHKDV